MTFSFSTVAVDQAGHVAIGMSGYETAMIAYIIGKHLAVFAGCAGTGGRETGFKSTGRRSALRKRLIAETLKLCQLN